MRIKSVKKILLVVAGLGVIAGAVFLIIPKIKGTKTIGSSSTKVPIAKKTETLSKEYAFPIKNTDGEDVGEIQFIIEKAELFDEIFVQGNRAKAVEGKEFLILSFKIINDTNNDLKVDSRDYVRLSVNGNEGEWFAPEIHNGAIDVQAISTVNTRVGFPVNETDKRLVLKVGEVDGEKEKVLLKLK